MKVSVVIPAFNEEKYIGGCLSSLQNQIEKADEVIVVNNNSTDATAEIAKHFGARVINQPKQGRTLARNLGFNEAKYEIIARCDADTHVPPDWIKKIKEVFQDESIDAVSGPAYYDDVAGAKVISVFFLFMYNLSAVVIKHKPLYGPNMAFRKSIWEKVKDEVCLDDTVVHEDMDLGIHMYQYGKIAYAKDIITHVSARRLVQNPLWLMVEYTARWFKTVAVNRSLIFGSRPAR